MVSQYETQSQELSQARAEAGQRAEELVQAIGALQDARARFDACERKKSHLQFKYDRIVSALRRYDAAGGDESVAIEREPRTLPSGADTLTHTAARSRSGTDWTTKFAVVGGHPEEFVQSRLAQPLPSGRLEASQASSLPPTYVSGTVFVCVHWKGGTLVKVR